MLIEISVGKYLNYLDELHIPNRDLNSYTFQYLYANVRVYGLAFEFRTPQIINAILHRIGLSSDLDEQLELHIQRDECYAEVRAKLRVHLPAVDRMTVQVTQPWNALFIFIMKELAESVHSVATTFTTTLIVLLELQES